MFVLAITQCTALMAANPTWEGLGQGLLVLAVLWWCWGGYAWLTSVVDPEEGAVRLVIFAAMAALLVVALCVPEAFGDLGLIFALAYGVVRAAHIGLFILASRDDPGLRRSTLGLAGEHRGRRRTARRRVVPRRPGPGGGVGRRPSPSTWPSRSSSAPRAGSSCPSTSPNAMA